MGIKVVKISAGAKLNLNDEMRGMRLDKDEPLDRLGGAIRILSGYVVLYNELDVFVEYYQTTMITNDKFNWTNCLCKHK